MCMEDYKIANRLQVRYWHTTSEQVIPADSRRVGILLCAQDTGDGTIFINPPQFTNPDTTSRIPAARAFAPNNQFYLSSAMLGEALLGALTLSSAGGQDVFAIETLLKDI